MHKTIPYWLQLHHCPGLKTSEIEQLLEHVAGPEEIVLASRSQLTQWNLSEKSIAYLKSSQTDNIQKDIDWCQQATNRYIISQQDPLYPVLLKQTINAPLVLYLQGNPLLLSMPQIAIVGSRNPSYQGAKNSCSFAAELANIGLVITSGMALGIDSAAHRGALQQNQFTIAVMGTGLDRVYPSRNIELAHQISETGLLVSEFVIGSEIKAYHFPKRNRIISGLSLGTLVIEAAVQSGSLITANLAAEQGREVFALPGSIHNPLAKGCHQLIQNGAKLVQSVQDILQELNALALYNKQQSPIKMVPRPKHLNEDISALEKKVLSAIDDEVTPIDLIIERLDLSVDKVTETVIMLELAGKVVSRAGGFSKL